MNILKECKILFLKLLVVWVKLPENFGIYTAPCTGVVL